VLNESGRAGESKGVKTYSTAAAMQAGGVEERSRAEVEGFAVFWRRTAGVGSWKCRGVRVAKW